MLAGAGITGAGEAITVIPTMVMATDVDITGLITEAGVGITTGMHWPLLISGADPI
jgi:hypothetical protein